jgi:phytoene synthase
VSAAPGISLEQAYRHCRDVTRRSGSSFAAAFWMLSEPRRRALHAVYAFCRMADDIADDPQVQGDRARLLERWRSELSKAYQGSSSHPVGIALADSADRYGLPKSLFEELLEGVAWDLLETEIETYEELRRYCFRVASTVGLLLVRILGYRHPNTLAYAEEMGIAVQLTNVLRDVGPDARDGRVYLPRADRERFGVTDAMLQGPDLADELRLLLGLYAERARIQYERAEALLPAEDRRRLRAAQAMGAIYRAMLDELQQRSFPCLRETVRLSRARRLWIAGAAWAGISAPDRGVRALLHPGARA